MIKIRIIAEGGIIREISAMNDFNEKVKIEVLDYDIDGIDDDQLHSDSDGIQHQKEIHNFN